MQEYTNVRDFNEIEKIFKKLAAAEEMFEIPETENLVLVLDYTDHNEITFRSYNEKDLDVSKSNKILQNFNKFFASDKNENPFNNIEVKSKTYFDQDNKSLFYIYQGNNEINTTCNHISSRYFLNKALEHASSVKILFAIPYTSVSDKQDFILRAIDAIKFLGDIQSLEKSIGLVITNVGTESDKDIISCIAGVLNEIKDDLSTSGMADYNVGSLKQKLMAFIEVFLTQFGDTSREFFFSKHSTHYGSLLLQNEKEIVNIYDFVNKKLHNLNKNEVSLHYPLPEEVKVSIRQFENEIKNNILLEFEQIKQNIVENYEIIEKNSVDLLSLQNKFRTLLITINKTQTTGDLGNYATSLYEELNNSNIDVKRKYLEKILNYNRYLKVLNVMGRNSEDTFKGTELNSAEFFSETITGIVQYLGSSEKWYRFLESLVNLLSTYEVQKDRMKYDISNVIDQITLGESKPLKLVDTGLKKLLDNFQVDIDRNGIETAYNDIKDDNISEQKVKALLQILTTTLNYKIEIIMSNSKDSVIIRGHYILFSEILKQLTEKLEYIEIHAINTIFIDEDFIMPGLKMLSLIAPSVNIIGERNISVDGRNNESQPKGKALSGVGPSARGEDGGPGLPGENAGNFMLIADKVNGTTLKVSAIGGAGSVGQDGGNGSTALKGDDPPDWVQLNWWRGTDFDREYINRTWRYKGFKVECNTNRKANQVECLVYGKLAKSGGEGGNGGAGGRGGNGGKAIIVDLSGSNKVRHSSSNGRDGPGGKGGIGGSGAVNGKWGSRKLLFLTNVRPYYTYSDLHDRGMSSKGQNGIDGRNSLGRNNPNPEVFENPSFTINNFKNFLRENLKRNEKESYLFDFIQKIENHPDIVNTYNTLGFVNELQGLENQFYRLQNEVPLLPFYQSILNRMEEYTLNPKEIDENKNITLEHKKVLSYSYSATLSKICSLKNKVKNDLIIDIPEYLKETLTKIDKMKVIINDVGKVGYYNEYSNDLDKEKEKAKNILETKIIPQIDVIGEDIQKDLNLLINEVNQLIKTNKNQIIENEVERKKLYKSIKLTSFFETLNVLANVLISFGCVQLQVFGTILEGASTISKIIFTNKTLNKKDIIMPGIKILPEYLDKIIIQMETLYKDKLDKLNKVIDTIQSEIDAKPKLNLKKMKPKISEIRKELNDAHDITSINTAKEKLIVYFKDEAEINKTEENEKVEFLEFWAKGISALASVSINMIDEIIQGKDLIKVIENKTKDSIINIFKLETLENLIYKSIIPECRKLENQIKDVIRDLKNKSHIQLDLTKWEVWNVIKEVQFIIRSVSNEFYVKDHLMHSFEKLEETMSAVINLYDRMVTLDDKARLAAYMGDLNSENALAVRVSSPQLNSALSSLHLILNSNIVLEEYDRAMEVFSQYVFPLANLYLEEYSLPTTLQLNNTQDGLLSVAMRKIETLRSKIIGSQITVGKYEKYIHKNILYTSEYPQLVPFYLWRSHENRDTIVRLLEGEEITLRADVNQAGDENAVKFNIIGINLKVDNKVAQEELNNMLNNFQVTMVHSGHSYFKCDEKYFTVTTDELTFSYFMKKNTRGHPINTNAVYDKIANSDFILSPYTLWKIKLSNVTKDYNFDMLKKFKNEVIDLELVGRGQYIESNTNEKNICSNNLRNYYKEEMRVQSSNNSLVGITTKPIRVEANNTFNLKNIRLRREEKDYFLNEDVYGSLPDLKEVEYPSGGYFSNLKYIYSSLVKKINVFGHLDKLIQSRKDLTSQVVIKNMNEFKLYLGIDDTKTENGANALFVNDNFIMSNQNLFLLDLMMRKFQKYKSNIKYKHVENNPIMKDVNDFSHKLAYRYYVR